MKIEFLKDYEVKDNSGTVYKKGQVVDVVNQASADHFVKRGAAMLYVQKPQEDTGEKKHGLRGRGGR